jgi:alginate O-acetyltransferase complex protein AlgI
MLFGTITFAVFFAVVFVVSWLVRPNPELWKPFVLVASYVFYGWWAPWMIAVLVALTLVTQVCVSGVAASHGRPSARRWLVVAIALPVGVLAFVKFGPLVDVDDVVANGRVMPVLVPLGLSYVVFQSVLYVLEVHRGQARPARLMDTALSLAFFPRLLCGPVASSADLLPQLHRRQDPRYLEAAPALRLVGTGLVKAVVISNFLAVEVVDPVFRAPSAHGAPEVLLAIFGFTAQLYCDVSGYADMAIGFALLLGVRLPANFASPLVASSFRDFWRRWHMTVTGFFREAVYVPLGGRRVGAGGTLANVFMVFAVAALWHGATTTFIAWGIVCGAIAVGERALLGGRLDAVMGVPRRVVGWAVTLVVVSFTFVLFRADSLSQAGDVVARLGHWSGGGDLVTPLALLVVVGVVVLQAVPSAVIAGFDTAFSRTPAVVQAVTLAVVLYLVARLGPDQAVPFYYLRF